MSLLRCPKCERKRHVLQKLERQNGKRYWIERCIECKTPITMEEYNSKDSKFKIDS